MKISKLSIVLLFLVAAVAPKLSEGQTLDCSKELRFVRAEPPFEFNSQSKSAVCTSGKTYELLISLYEGYEYRLSFSADAVFNNDMHFKIVDMNTSNTVLDLPGQSTSGEIGTQVLKSYYDRKEARTVQPHFDFYPESTTNLKIIITVAEKKTTAPAGTYDNSGKTKGCLTMLLLDKKVPIDDWEKK